MSMHLVGPYMTTTVYSRKKGKPKKKTQAQIQSEIKHEKYLRKMGVHPDQRKDRERESSSSASASLPSSSLSTQLVPVKNEEPCGRLIDASSSKSSLVSTSK